MCIELVIFEDVTRLCYYYFDHAQSGEDGEEKVIGMKKELTMLSDCQIVSGPAENVIKKITNMVLHQRFTKMFYINDCSSTHDE